MILLNTSFHVLASRQQEFIDWATSALSNFDRKPTFCRILTVVDPDVSSFAMQWRFDTLEYAEQWEETAELTRLQQLRATMGDDAMYFTTYMEEL
ncbi:MAG: DUF4286 family protein [Muribaculaceae bacterium]|nr:DUF4286 family protein [Muribaculaceae bacterium]